MIGDWVSILEQVSKAGIIGNQLWAYWTSKPDVHRVAPRTKFVEEGAGLAALMGREVNWIRVAGVTGALAVTLGAYGEHALDVPPERKRVWNTAIKYQLIHTLALLAAPLTRRPKLVGALLLGGMTVFCGTCYAHALTGIEKIIMLTPLGKLALIFAWLAMVL